MCKRQKTTKMKNIFFLISLSVIFPLILCNEICTTCNCSSSDKDSVWTINCVDRNLQHVNNDWPNSNNAKTIKITFSGNPIHTLEPLAPTNATVQMALSNCQLQYLMPGLFNDVPNIVFLDLSHNKLEAKEISAEKFRGPYNDQTYAPIALEHLDLSYNQIHSIGKNAFEHMPNLKILNLDGNDFSVLDIHTQLALKSIRNLQSLNLAHNELTELIPSALESHENLTELDLSNNLLDFVPRSLSTIGKSLTILRIDGNPIFQMTAETFLGLENVVELQANNLIKLRHIDGNAFASMKKLKKLSISNNFVLEQIDREAFGVNQSIEEFYLNNNNLFRIDYKLLPWSKLHIFEFNDNPLDCSCDLYNITSDLSKDITRNENGPFCADPRTKRYTQVFHLKKDICTFKILTHENLEAIQQSFSIMTVALIGLSSILALMTIVAVFVGIIKFRRYQRASGYPFANSQIVYEPVTDVRF